MSQAEPKFVMACDDECLFTEFEHERVGETNIQIFGRRVLLLVKVVVQENVVQRVERNQALNEQPTEISVSFFKATKQRRSELLKQSNAKTISLLFSLSWGLDREQSTEVSISTNCLN